jgi:hypothetical protein
MVSNSVDMREKVDAPEVAGGEVEPGAAGQAIARGLDIVDVTGSVGLAAGHPALHKMGDVGTDARLDGIINKNNVLSYI